MSILGVTSSNFWYRVDQAWDQSRRAISQQYLDESSILSSSLSDAMTNQISGIATLAAQAALKRIKGATTAAMGKVTSPITVASSAVRQNASATNSSATINSSGSGSQYAYTSAANILSSANVVSFFA